jgi:tRNA dimethylallyltransferase
MPAPPPVILILGPTASGKTAVAIELAKRLGTSTLGGECLCADSMQVYRRMDIGTAKPTPEERGAVPHHLLDLVEPHDDGFSVDRWLDLAHVAMTEIRSRHRATIVVGGTNLYVQTLLFGLADVPPPDPCRRAELARLDTEVLRRRLEAADPQAATRIHPRDRRRTIRAIEVFERTGTRLSGLQRQWSAGRLQLPDTLIIGLDFSITAINARINTRVRGMLEAGLVEEVRGLWESGSLGRNAREALGYKQVVAHLEGRCTLEEAVEEIKIRTRRFAKQQRSWLRRFRHLRPSFWVSAADLQTQDIVNEALTFINFESSEGAKRLESCTSDAESRGCSG